MAANPYAQYQKNQVETAGQAKLILMLYEGAVRFLEGSRKALQEGELQKAHQNLVRAQDILAELMSSLDLEAGDVAVNLFRLYDYMYNQLVQANVKKDAEPLEQVEKMLLELRDAWKESLGYSADEAAKR